MANQKHIESVKVVVGCPSCGERGYEFDLEPDDLDAHVSYLCDDCGQRIEVVVGVMVQAVKR